MSQIDGRQVNEITNETAQADKTGKMSQRLVDLPQQKVKQSIYAQILFGCIKLTVRQWNREPEESQ